MTTKFTLSWPWLAIGFRESNVTGTNMEYPAVKSWQALSAFQSIEYRKPMKSQNKYNGQAEHG